MDEQSHPSPPDDDLLVPRPTNGNRTPAKPSKRRQWRRVEIVNLEVRHRRSIWAKVPPVLKAKDVAQVVREFLGNLDREWFVVLCVDANYQPTRMEAVAGGTLQHVKMSPKEVFTIAVKTLTAAIWFVHNHPTGPVYPTQEDVDSTDELILGGSILKIPILDHVILGPKRDFLSFADEGLLLQRETSWDTTGGMLRLWRLFMGQQAPLVRDLEAGGVDTGGLMRS